MFDLCQEPLPSIDSRPEPAQVAQLALTRAASARVQWSRATLVSLLTPSERQPPLPDLSGKDYLFVVESALRTTPAYQQAQVAARSG
ncbi:MAG TPA: hypothetical protein VIJ44_08210 [Acidimicrobiia bacterium]